MRTPVDGSRGRHGFAATLPYLTFILTGVVNTLLGPILPWLSDRWSLADADAGAFFTLQFAASLAAGFGSGVVASRLGSLRTVSLGLACMAAGAAAIGLGTRSAAVVGVATSGIGLGLTIPTTNILVARAFRAKASAALSALNLAWGIGAAAWPLIVAIAPAAPAALLGVATSLAILAVVCGLSPAAGEKPERQVPLTRARSMMAWPSVFFVGFFFLYGGSEAAVGGWLTEFAHRLDPRASATAASAAFWAGLTTGRGLVALFVVEAHEARLALGGVTVAVLALAGLLVARTVPMVIVVAAVAGVGFAPLFPVTVAALSRGRISGWAGPLISLTSIGAATLPWLVGVASTRSGSLQVGLLVPLTGCVLLGALQAAFWSRRRPLQAL